MFVKLLSTLAAIGLATAVSAQQMPMPSAGSTAIGTVAKGITLPSAPVLPGTADLPKSGTPPSTAAAKTEPTIGRTTPIAPTLPATTKAAPQPIPNGTLSIKQVAEAQRLQLASETAQKLGLSTPAQQSALPAPDFVKPYRAPKQYPKIEYVAGTVGQEKVGFRMPDGELLALETGSYIKQWRIKDIVNGRVFLELPQKKVSAKSAKKQKAHPPVTRSLSVGQSLK